MQSSFHCVPPIPPSLPTHSLTPSLSPPSLSPPSLSHPLTSRESALDTWCVEPYIHILSILHTHTPYAHTHTHTHTQELFSLPWLLSPSESVVECAAFGHGGPTQVGQGGWGTLKAKIKYQQKADLGNKSVGTELTSYSLKKTWYVSARLGISSRIMQRIWYL